MRASLWVLCVILSATAGAADDWAPAKKLDAWFDSLEKGQMANGAIAISEHGELRYERFVGTSVPGAAGAQPIDVGTRFWIGPVSQLFTTVLTLQLAEKASITLDNRLAEFYPDLPNALDITYRDLLQQRSGLADYTAGPIAEYQQWRSAPRTPTEILQRIGAGGAKFAPRSRVEYSASNYLVLGYILEKVYEKPYAEILRLQITDRIGLSRTGTGEADAARALAAAGQAAVPDPRLHGGAGAVVSTPVNLVRFMDALFARRLVSEYNLAAMRGQDGEPPVGLTTFLVSGQTGYGVAGAIDGYWGAVYHFPAKKISVAFCSSAPRLAPEEILDETFAILFKRGHQPRTFKPAE